jgi:RNA polymerase sigma-70 factor (ECF subfamily)
MKAGNHTNRSDVQDHTDEELMQRLKGGDNAAFDTIVSRYKHKLFGTLCRITKNADISEEILQETFIRVYTKCNSYKSRYRFSTWIYTIALNQMKTQMKRRNAFISLERVKTDSMMSESSSSAKQHLKLELEQAIEKLPVEYRTAFLLRDVDGLAYKEMGRIMKCRVGTAKSRVHRARTILRRELGPRLQSGTPGR